MTDIHWTIHDTFASLTTALCSELCERLRAAIDARGRALIVLPGGVTPLPIFEHWAEIFPHWDKVTILPSDDRFAPMSSPLSNAAMLSRYFSPKGATVLPLTDGAGDYRDAGRKAAEMLQDLPWPPDFVWVGMGGDGHTASLFRGPDLDAALTTQARAIGLRPDPLPPEAPVARVTLSLSALISSPALFLAISGAEKQGVMERAIREGCGSALPIGRLLAAAPSVVSVHWSP